MTIRYMNGLETETPWSAAEVAEAFQVPAAVITKAPPVKDFWKFDDSPEAEAKLQAFANALGVNLNSPMHDSWVAEAEARHAAFYASLRETQEAISRALAPMFVGILDTVRLCCLSHVPAKLMSEKRKLHRAKKKRRQRTGRK